MFDLYILETCPYSLKVMNFLNSNGIKYNKKDITIPQNLEMLLKLGGMQQVPFLHDEENNVNMYESDDIIEYIKNKV